MLDLVLILVLVLVFVVFLLLVWVLFWCWSFGFWCFGVGFHVVLGVCGGFGGLGAGLGVPCGVLLQKLAIGIVTRPPKSVLFYI